MIYRHIDIPKQMFKLKSAIDKGYSIRNTDEQVRKDQEYERFVEKKKQEAEEKSSGPNSP